MDLWDSGDSAIPTSHSTLLDYHIFFACSPRPPPHHFFCDPPRGIDIFLEAFLLTAVALEMTS